MGRFNGEFTGWSSLYCKSCSRRVGKDIFAHNKRGIDRPYASFDDFSLLPSSETWKYIFSEFVFALFGMGMIIAFAFIFKNYYLLLIPAAVLIFVVFGIRKKIKGSGLFFPAPCPKCGENMSRIPLLPKDMFGSVMDEKHFPFLVKIYLWDMARAYTLLEEKEISEITGVMDSLTENAVLRFDKMLRDDDPDGRNKESFMAYYPTIFANAIERLKLIPHPRSKFSMVDTRSVAQINEIVEKTKNTVLEKIYEKHGRPAVQPDLANADDSFAGNSIMSFIGGKIVKKMNDTTPL